MSFDFIEAPPSIFTGAQRLLTLFTKALKRYLRKKGTTSLIQGAPDCTNSCMRKSSSKEVENR